MLSVGFIDYINSYPLNGAFRLKKINPQAQLTFQVPSELNRMLRDNTLDASFISLYEFVEGDYIPIGEFGIAAQDAILSVNLYIKNSLSSLHHAKVGVTSESATSVQLLKILCRHFWNVSPHFEILNPALPLSDYEGILLIGDRALKNLTLPGFTTIDLATEWYEKTGTPCVFAVFAAQKNLSLQKKEALALFTERLKESLNWSIAHPEEITMLASQKTGVSKEVIEKYYQICHFKLGSEHKNAIHLFKELANGILC